METSNSEEESNSDSPQPPAVAAPKLDAKLPPKAPAKSESATKSTELSEDEDPVATHEVKAE
jgi:hypothetical protein